VKVQLHELLTSALDGRKWSPRPIYSQVKSPRYPLDRRLGGPKNRSGRGGEEKNSQSLPGFEPPIHPVAERYTTELSRSLITLRASEEGKCVQKL